MRRKLIIIVSALVLVVGVSLAVIMLVKQSPKLQNVVNSLANKKASNANTAPTNASVTNSAIVSPDRTVITFVARNFTERFGSGSSENGGSNLVAAQDYGTRSYNDYLSSQIAKAQANPSATYSGTVTRALAFDFLKLSANNASVVVTTQYTTTTAATSKTVNRDLLVDLVKVDGDWKVNAAAWK